MRVQNLYVVTLSHMLAIGVTFAHLDSDDLEPMKPCIEDFVSMRKLRYYSFAPGEMDSTYLFGHHPFYDAQVDFVYHMCCVVGHAIVQLESPSHEQVDVLSCNHGRQLHNENKMLRKSGGDLFIIMSLYLAGSMMAQSEHNAYWNDIVDPGRSRISNCRDEFGRRQPINVNSALCAVALSVQLQPVPENNSVTYHYHASFGRPHNHKVQFNACSYTHAGSFSNMLAITRGFVLLGCYSVNDERSSFKHLMQHRQDMLGVQLEVSMSSFIESSETLILGGSMMKAVTSNTTNASSILKQVMMYLPSTRDNIIRTNYTDHCDSSALQGLEQRMCLASTSCERMNVTEGDCDTLNDACFMDVLIWDKTRKLSETSRFWQPPTIACCRLKRTDANMPPNNIEAFMEPWQAMIKFIWRARRDALSPMHCPMGYTPKGDFYKENDTMTCQVVLDSRMWPVNIGYVLQYFKNAMFVKTRYFSTPDGMKFPVDVHISPIQEFDVKCDNAGHYYHLSQLRVNVTLYLFTCPYYLSTYLPETCDVTRRNAILEAMEFKFKCEWSNGSSAVVRDEYCFSGYRMFRNSSSDTRWTLELSNMVHRGPVSELPVFTGGSTSAQPFTADESDRWVACGLISKDETEAFWFCVCQAWEEPCNSRKTPAPTVALQSPIAVQGAKCPFHQNCPVDSEFLQGILVERQKPLCWLIAPTGHTTVDDGGCVEERIKVEHNYESPQFSANIAVTRAQQTCAKLAGKEGPDCFVLAPVLDDDPNIVCCCRADLEQPDECVSAEHYTYQVKKSLLRIRNFDSTEKK